MKMIRFIPSPGARLDAEYRWRYKTDIDLAQALCSIHQSGDPILIQENNTLLEMYEEEIERYYELVYRPEHIVLAELEEIKKRVEESAARQKDLEEELKQSGARSIIDLIRRRGKSDNND